MYCVCGHTCVCMCTCARVRVCICHDSLSTHPPFAEPAEAQDIPVSDDLITLDDVRTLKEIISITERYILAGFCGKR